MAEPSGIEKAAEAQADATDEIEVVIGEDEPQGEDIPAGGDKQPDKAEDQGDEAAQGETAEQAAERKAKPPHRTRDARIDKLTREKRDLERQVVWEREERARQSEASDRRIAELADRMAKFEQSYTADTTATRIAQAEGQVEANLAAVKARLKQAVEDTNSDAIADANAELAQLHAAKTQIAAFKAQHEREKTKPREEPKQEQAEQRQQFDPQHVYLLNKWVGDNGWFRTNRQLNAVARAIDQELTEENQRTGNFDPRGEDRYIELSRRMEPYLLAAGVKEPDEPEPKPQQQAQHRPPITAAVAGVTRTNPTASQANKVKLTPEEVQTATKLGVSLKDYAAQKVRMLERIEQIGTPQ